MEDLERPLKTESNVSAGSLVLRNTLFLGVGQVLTIPVSILINALSARYLGATEFGYIYLAGTMCGFGFLAIEWGQPGVLPAAIARDHRQASVLLGSALAWRLIFAVFVYFVLAAACHLFGYGAHQQWALGLTFLGACASSCAGAFKDTIRGFERTDVSAYAQFGQQLLMLLLLTPVLLLGGKMRAALLAQAIGVAIVAALLWRALRIVDVRALSFRRSAVGALFKEGTPFVFFGLAMTLQPSIDALYLSKLAPAEVMGWFAVCLRLQGVLLFPATTLLSALYPTLCRLFASDNAAFVRVTRGALYSVTLLVVPVALGCGLYPDIGISIFSRTAFRPAEDNLRVAAVFLLLVYFTMPLGICILAAGKQRTWSIVQSMCVVVSLVLDPLLIPWFQKRTGNGSVGVNVAAVVGELVVIGAGIALAPRGVFDRHFARSMLLASISGGAMVLVALVLRPITPFVAAPLAVLSYGIALVATGGIEKSQVAAVRGFIGRKFSRLRSGA